MYTLFYFIKTCFDLSLLFFSNIDSSFAMIGVDAVFTVELNGSGPAEICMTLPDFAEEELELGSLNAAYHHE